MLPERHPPIIGHSKYLRCGCVGNGYVKECDCWLCVVFVCPRCNECDGGFVCGDLESVVGKPLFQGVHVLLKVCGSSLGFRVLSENCDVVCIGEKVGVWVCGEWDVVHVEVKKCG